MSDTTLMHDPDKICPECLQATAYDQREYWRRAFAGMAMQALCGMRYDDEVARVAVKLADALSAELEGGEG